MSGTTPVALAARHAVEDGHPRPVVELSFDLVSEYGPNAAELLHIRAAEPACPDPYALARPGGDGHVGDRGSPGRVENHRAHEGVW